MGELPAENVSSRSVDADVTQRAVGPRRGSSAAKQKRDAGGRFSPRRARKVSGAPRGRSGRSGASHHARLSHLGLVRVLIVLEHRVGRLEAERDGVMWSDPVQRPPANVHGLRAVESKRVAKTVAVLTDIIEDLHVARDEVIRHDAEKLAEMLSKRLGRKVWGRTLYRAPYDGIWRDPAEMVGQSTVDEAATFSDRARLPRRHLIYRIERMQRMRDELLPLLRARLVALSDADPDAWKPLEPPRPRGSALRHI